MKSVFLIIKRIAKIINLQLSYNILRLRFIFSKFQNLCNQKYNLFSQGLSRVLNCSLHSLKNNILNKSIFSWNLNYYTAYLRTQIVIIGFLLVFVIIIVRLLFIAYSGNVSNSGNVEINKSSKKLNISNIDRFDITDRNHNLLAVNLPGASLYANPRKIIDPNLAVEKLQTVFPKLDKKNILAKLKGNKNFVWIKRDITPQEHEKIHNLGMPGFDFEREQKRIYAYGSLLSHVIGYVGRDLNGLAGLEKYFDKFLTSQEEQKMQEDQNPLSDSLNLSIDVRVQNILSEEIDKTMKKFSAKGAAGIIVDPNNGEIIALVSKPDFDPHYPGKASPEQLFNMATQGVYELGSGMKAITMAIGFDTGATSMQDAYDLTYMKVNGFQLKDTYPVKGWHSVPYIFLKSSNIGVTQIMFEIGSKKLVEYWQKLGLVDRAQIELPERARPLFPKEKDLTDLSLTTISYGYGISVSPLHFMQAMVPIINGGMMYPLTLLKQDDNQMPIGKRVLQEKTSIAMRKLMNLTVTKGTGSKAKINEYYVGGKTGTANIASGGKYDKTRRISSFFGIIPASDPKYMIYIVFNEPKGIKETFGFAGGGWTGAPTVGAVFKRMIALYGIDKPDESSKEVQELIDVKYKIQ